MPATPVLLGILGTDMTAGGPSGTGFTSTIATQASVQVSATETEITVGAPAAGTEWAYTVPPNTWMRVHSGSGSFSTSSTVASRAFGLRILDASSNVIEEAEVTNQVLAASLSNVSMGMTQSGADTTYGSGDGLRTVGVCLFGFVIPPGYIFTSHMASIQSGDQWGSWRFFVEMWTAGSPIIDPVGPMST